MSLLQAIVSRKTKEKCKGSKQKCEKPVNTFHNLSVVLAVVIPVVCVFLIVLSIIFYLWRRHKKEEKLEAEFDNKVEEDINEVFYKEKPEDNKPVVNNENSEYKNKGRLAIMRKRMKDLENKNQSTDDLSFFQPPIKRTNSITSFSSQNSKGSILASNDGLNIPLIPSSPSKVSLGTPTKDDNILLNSSRLEDISEHDMRDYMKHYDKMMGMTNMENMTGSFPGGRVPSQILQRNKFFPRNPYVRGNNTGTLVKRFVTPKPVKKEEEDKKENEEEKELKEDVKSTEEEINKNPFLTEAEKKESKESSVNSHTTVSINTTENEIEAPKAAEKESSEADADTEVPNDTEISSPEVVEDNIIVDKLFSNDVNKRIYSNMKANDSGLLHEVEKYDVTKVNEALKDINEAEDKDDIILSSKQEENIKRMKSIYQIYMDKNEDDDEEDEEEEAADKLGDLSYTNPNQSKQSKSFKHTSSIYSDSFANKGYELPGKKHALPNYDISQYQEQSTDLNIHDIPNPELYSDYYELDPQSEQYYYYDAPSQIHFYFEPVSQQYYYYDEREEQYYCNINSEVYFYDSINHIPYYYDYEEEAYIYLGEPELDNTQFQQNTQKPNNFRNLQLEQHIVETEEDHPERIENIEYLRNPSSMNNLTSSSMTNFMTANNRKITPQRQVKQQLSQNFSYDTYENIHNGNASANGSKAAYKIARESVVMNDPLQFSGTKTKFKPAGSIRNLNSYIQGNQGYP